jgi:hypothetical protein
MDELRKLNKAELATFLIMTLDHNICAKEKAELPLNKENFTRCVVKELEFFTPAQYVDNYLNKKYFNDE